MKPGPNSFLRMKPDPMVPQVCSLSSKMTFGASGGPWNGPKGVVSLNSFIHPSYPETLFGPYLDNEIKQMVDVFK